MAEFEIEGEGLEVDPNAEAPESAFEVVDESAPAQEGPSREELLAKFEQTQKELAELKASQATQSRFDELSSTIHKIVERPINVQAPSVQAPEESDADFKERLQRQLLDDPAAALNDWGMRFMGKGLNTIIAGQEKLSRKLALSDPENKKLYDKYSSEIEVEIQRIPVQDRVSDPDVYGRAFSAVRGRHLEDVIAERVQAELDKALAAKGIGGASANPPTKPQPVGVVDRGSALASGTSTTAKPRITSRQATNIKNMMQSRGIPIFRFEDTVLDIIEAGELAEYN